LETYTVGAGFLQENADCIEWLGKNLEKSRNETMTAEGRARRAEAMVRIAVGHLQAVLKDQQNADTAARNWLNSIGDELFFAW